jgi:hypothetical protein
MSTGRSAGVCQVCHHCVIGVFVAFGVFGVFVVLGVFMCLHVHSICMFVMFAWFEFSALELLLCRDCSKEHS